VKKFEWPIIAGSVDSKGAIRQALSVGGGLEMLRMLKVSNKIPQHRMGVY